MSPPEYIGTVYVFTIDVGVVGALHARPGQAASAKDDYFRGITRSVSLFDP